MKNIFKFMGIAMMACSLMVACGDKNEGENNDTTPVNPPAPSIADGINVTFNGTSWTAAVNNCLYYAQYEATQFSGAQTEDAYPIFDEIIYANAVGTTTEVPTSQMAQFSNQTHLWVEYYENMYLQDNNGDTYGDWWAAEATTDIKAIDLTALTVTAVLEGTFFSAYEAFTQNGGATGFEGASRAPYRATFGNVTMSAK